MTTTELKDLLNLGTEQAKRLLVQEYILEMKGKQVEINVHPIHLETLYGYAEEYFNKKLGTVFVSGSVKTYKLVKQ